MFYLLLSGNAVLYRVFYNLEKISTLDLEEEEEETSWLNLRLEWDTDYY